MTSSKIINRLVAVVYTSLQIQKHHCLHMRNRFSIWYTQYLDPVLCFSYRATSSLFSMSLLMLIADRLSRKASFTLNHFAICKLYIETNVQQSPKTIYFPSSTNYTVNVTATVLTCQGIRFLFPDSATKPIFYCSSSALACKGDNSMAQMWWRSLRCHTQRGRKYVSSLGHRFTGSAHRGTARTAHTCSYADVVKLSDWFIGRSSSPFVGEE